MVPQSRNTSSRSKKRRVAFSCTECTRRKLRCSKTVPCTACTDRGIEHSCQRRNLDRGSDISSTVSLSGSQRASDRHRRPESLHEASLSQASTISTEREQVYPEYHSVQSQVNRDTLHASGQDDLASDRPIDNIATDAPVALEFLTLNRRRVPRLDYTQHETSVTADIGTELTADPILTPGQVHYLVDYHWENLTWTHNVVHLPTFQRQCSDFLVSRIAPEKSWLALYYALLSMTVYHTSSKILERIDISEHRGIATVTYRKALDALEEADYTAIHSVSTVQAICLLIYVGYNIGDSDRISVLLATAIRIAQCLGMHRLGVDNPSRFNDLDSEGRARAVVKRELHKRIWWFLVRQDWLQIPFANTYTVHPSQFNTPMPANCFDDLEFMVKDGQLTIQDKETHTHCSYTNVLNYVAVLIWKTQDRLCQVGPPEQGRDGLHKLYDVVLQADSELKDIMLELPDFLRVTPDRGRTTSMHSQHQSRAMLLTFAHKFYSIHRHFQVLSFRNNRFAYSRMSCVSIALRSLRVIFDSPDDDCNGVVRALWTVNTQVVTATIWIIFELLFSREGENTAWSDLEMRDAIETASKFLEPMQHKSRIAGNGIRLINMLLSAASRTDNLRQVQVDLEEIIACIKRDTVDEERMQEETSFHLDPIRISDWISTWDELEYTEAFGSLLNSGPT